MKKTLILMVITVLIPGFTLGCQELDGVQGSGKLQSQDYDFSDFNKLEISNAFEIEILPSDSYSVDIIADDNILEYVNIATSGDTLKIGLEPVTLLWPITLEAKVTMPELLQLVLVEAARGTISKFHLPENLVIYLSGASTLELTDISGDNIKINVTEAGYVTGDIQADDIELNLDKASSVRLEGLANNMIVNADGASRTELSDFRVNHANIALSGASIGTINVDGRLDATLNDASKLSYFGEPTMGTISTSGASTLSWK